jgi:hypothetical protein
VEEDEEGEEEEWEEGKSKKRRGKSILPGWTLQSANSRL